MKVIVKWKDQNIQPNITTFDCAFWDALVSTNISCPMLTLFRAKDDVVANIPLENILYYTIQE